jgi:hypothetical protein
VRSGGLIAFFCSASGKTGDAYDVHAAPEGGVVISEKKRLGSLRGPFFIMSCPPQQRAGYSEAYLGDGLYDAVNGGMLILRALRVHRRDKHAGLLVKRETTSNLNS